MIGFLHIEMCLQECGGKILGGFGWEQMFQKAGIYTSGVASSLLGGKHVKRTHQAYYLTLAWLEICSYQAYEKYCEQTDQQEPLEV